MILKCLPKCCGSLFVKSRGRKMRKWDLGHGSYNYLIIISPGCSHTAARPVAKQNGTMVGRRIGRAQLPKSKGLFCFFQLASSASLTGQQWVHEDRVVHLAESYQYLIGLLVGKHRTALTEYCVWWGLVSCSSIEALDFRFAGWSRSHFSATGISVACNKEWVHWGGKHWNWEGHLPLVPASRLHPPKKKKDEPWHSSTTEHQRF